MYINESLVAQYGRDGYIILPKLFSGAEVAAMLDDIGGERIVANTRGKEDTTGRKARLAIWHELGDDIWAAASTNPRLINAVRVLMAEDVAFFHGKVMLKEAGTGGAWEWHQDYGYWYNQGFLYPRMLSVFVALDAATTENGCLSVLKGSHLLGRLEHGKVGDQTGADPARMPLLEPLFERVPVTMNPGDALFFHSNLLHTSGPNNSDTHRRSFIICYNALANPQLVEKPTFEQRPCPVGADDNILQAAQGKD